MRPNIITEAGIPTRLNQWWSSIPFVTSGVVLICGVIYLLCLLIGYDSYAEICFLPSAVASHFQGLSPSHTSPGNITCFFNILEGSKRNFPFSLFNMAF